MNAEKCMLKWLKPGTPFYASNPFEEPPGDAPPGWYVPPQYVGQSDLDPDTWVWVVYEDWLRDNPYLKPEAHAERGIEVVPSTRGVFQAISGMDVHLCK